jgi:hypothetical protein
MEYNIRLKVKDSAALDELMEKHGMKKRRS